MGLSTRLSEKKDCDSRKKGIPMFPPSFLQEETMRGNYYCCEERERDQAATIYQGK